MYQPNEPPQTDDLERAELILAIWEEFNKIANVLNNLEVDQIKLRTLHVEPTKPTEGVVARADGTDWNPVAGGEGVYEYTNAAAWSKLQVKYVYFR